MRCSSAILLHVQQNRHRSKSKNKIIGNQGEEIAAMYLENHGFTILSRNYLKKWGEIDIVARGTNEILHFVEVKTVSYETKQALELSATLNNWRPEENVHPQKLKRLHRAIESWIAEYRYTGNWQIDVASVRIVPREKYARIIIISNVIFE